MQKEIQAQTESKKKSWMPALDLSDLLPAVVTFGLIAIVGAVVALILQNFLSQSTVGNGTVANNVINFGLQGVSTLSSYLPLIALVIVAAILIGIVLLAFQFGQKKSERF